MRYETAATIGRLCGLDKPAEFVNNIELHRLNLFSYEEMDSQIEELRQDAKEHGVRFSTVCGDAVLDGDSVEEVCYICRGIQRALDSDKE